jgi:glycosyltransferase involved in cell wall biosynthesis
MLKEERRNRDSRKKLAIFAPSLREGGAERAAVVLSNEFAKHGHSVDMVLAQAEGPHLAELQSPVRVVDLKCARVLSSIPKLAWYLRQERPATVLSLMNHANIAALWARRISGVRTRLIVSERNTLSTATENCSGQLERWIPGLIRRFYPWADGISAVSHGVADDLAAVTAIPRESIRVIYNPVARPELRAKARQTPGHPWFEPGQPPTVLAVGRLRQQKGFTMLLRAFAEVRQCRPARLLILGEGPDREELQSLVMRLGLAQHVQLPGFVANPYPYMARAAVFVLSSDWEGLPAVLIEALYCGTAVVSTDCPSGPREILAGGRHGALVPVGNSSAMAAAIRAALDGKTPRACPESWAQFELGAVINQYAELLQLEN